MRTRREFMAWVAGSGALLACAGDVPPSEPPEPDADETPPPSIDAGGDAQTQPVDAGCTMTVTLYDMHAMALYLDGGLGPRTGIVRVADIAAGVEQPRDFWHGHGNQLHRFTITPAHFAALRRRERILIETTEVDGHRHTLFVDPTDPQWRVEGAAPQTIPAC
jgi:hypothetical protein